MAYNAELQMLRELAWFMLPQQTCYFCVLPLSGPVSKTAFERGEITFGHRRHRQVTVRITIHHLDEDRENNKPDNLVLCHTLCHKLHHSSAKTTLKEINVGDPT